MDPADISPWSFGEAKPRTDNRGGSGGGGGFSRRC